MVLRNDLLLVAKTYLKDHIQFMNDCEEKIYKHLTEAIAMLSSELSGLRQQRTIELEWFKSHLGLATKHDLREVEKNIMSIISDFAAKQKAFNDRQGASIDSLVTSNAGISADVKTLNDKIEELQNSPGAITPEDQALLNDLETTGDSLATRLDAASAALKALDEQTPPTPPVG